MKQYTELEMHRMCNKARQSFIHPVTKAVLITAGKKDMIFKFDPATSTYS